MSRAVVTPTGEAWRVGRCWLPKQRVHWRGPGRVRRTSSDPRPRSGGGSWLNALDVFDGDNPLAALGFVIGTIVFAALVWFFLVPLLLVLLDVTVLVVLTAAGVAARVVLHRPWEIEAVGPNERLTWQVVGWQRSRLALGAVTQRLARGEVLPTDSPGFPPR
jgi:hypothetical protein